MRWIAALIITAATLAGTPAIAQTGEPMYPPEVACQSLGCPGSPPEQMPSTPPLEDGPDSCWTVTGCPADPAPAVVAATPVTVTPHFTG